MLNSIKILLLATIFGVPTSQDIHLKLSVFYETLCPDSINFIETQLFPNYKIFQSYITLDLVPFGKGTATIVDGKWSFICQHGPNECYGNKYHSCAIALHPISQSSAFVYCSMGTNNPAATENLKQCSTQAGIPWNSLLDCFRSGNADELLVMNGKRTQDVSPRISFVPTIIINGHYDQNVQQAALKDLKSVLCEFLENIPTQCNDYEVLTV